MHKEWEIRSLLSEETLEKAWRNLKEMIGSEMRVFGRWRDRAIEREIKRNEVRIARGRIYRTSVNLDKWRCRKVSSQVSRIWPSTNTGVEQVSRYKNIRHKRWGLIDPPSVEKLSRGQELSRSIHQVSRRCQDCDKKKVGSSTDSQVLRRCQANF